MKRGMLILVVFGALVAAVRFAFHAYQAVSTAGSIDQNQDKLAHAQPADEVTETTARAARGYRFQFRDLLGHLGSAARDAGVSSQS